MPAWMHRFQELEPAFFRRQFQLEHCHIVGAADPTNAQEADDLVFRGNDGRFNGVSFFFPL